MEWHQDWAFYPHTNDDLLAVGVMLDDCTSDNGPLLVVPGTHRGPTFDHHTGDHHAGRYFCGAIDPAAIRDEIARAVPLTARAGSMSFHHVRLVHGSAQNVSSLPRTLLLYEYGAADAWPLMGVSRPGRLRRPADHRRAQRRAAPGAGAGAHAPAPGAPPGLDLREPVGRGAPLLPGHRRGGGAPSDVRSAASRRHAASPGGATRKKRFTATIAKKSWMRSRVPRVGRQLPASTESTAS